MGKLGLFVEAIYGHWQAAWLGTMSLIVAVILWVTKQRELSWAAFGAVAFICLFIASFQVWKEKEAEVAKRTKEIEGICGWEAIAKRFKDLDDGGVLIARWSKNLSTGTRTWEIQGHSLQMQNISTEIIKMAGKRLPTSRDIADDCDRWLEAMVTMLEIGKVTGTGSSVIKDVRHDFEFGAIKNLIGESQRMCLRLLNKETED